MFYKSTRIDCILFTSVLLHFPLFFSIGKKNAEKAYKKGGKFSLYSIHPTSSYSCLRRQPIHIELIWVLVKETNSSILAQLLLTRRHTQEILLPRLSLHFSTNIREKSGIKQVSSCPFAPILPATLLFSLSLSPCSLFSVYST